MLRLILSTLVLLLSLLQASSSLCSRSFCSGNVLVTCAGGFQTSAHVCDYRCASRRCLLPPVCSSRKDIDLTETGACTPSILARPIPAQVDGHLNYPEVLTQVSLLNDSLVGNTSLSPTCRQQTDALFCNMYFSSCTEDVDPCSASQADILASSECPAQVVATLLDLTCSPPPVSARFYYMCLAVSLSAVILIAIAGCWLVMHRERRV